MAVIAPLAHRSCWRSSRGTTLVFALACVGPVPEPEPVSATRAHPTRAIAVARAPSSQVLMRSVAMELASAKTIDDSAAFAFGGVWPGTLHAKGRLPESHRVSYSVGVAGTYLLHVRLRQAAAALPGSPFMLTISPGKACASSSELPAEIVGEVGGQCSYTISTGDQTGNACVEGGGSVTCPVDAKHSSTLQAECKDNGDGTYTLTWHSVRTGTFEVSVKIDSSHVVNSPTRIRLRSTRQDISKCELIGDGLSYAIKEEESRFRIQFRDAYLNYTEQSDAFKRSFRAGMALASSDGKTESAGPTAMPFTATWVALEGQPDGSAAYEMSYKPTTSGSYLLHVWAESGTAEKGRLPLSGSPFGLSVHANANDFVTTEVCAIGFAPTPPPYSLDRGVCDWIRSHTAPTLP